MARKVFKPRLHDSGSIVTTKTFFGSTSDMIVDLSQFNPIDRIIQDNEVVCKDDKGYYITLKSRIDSGMADPNRYANASSRIDLSEQKVLSS